MSKGKDIRAGGAFVELYTKGDKLAGGLQAAAARLKAFGASVTAIGAKTAAVGAGLALPFVAAAKAYADTGSALLEMSQRTGLTVESLSELKYAADQSGSSIEDVERALRFMGKTIAGADDESKKAVESLDRLGLTAEQLSALSIDDRFELIAERLSNIEDAGERSARVMSLFGRGGAALLPLMTDGAKGIKALREEARRLGLTMSTEDATNAERFGDAMSSVTATVQRAIVHIGSALAPTLEKVANWLTEAAKNAGEFVKENQGVVRIAAIGAVALLSLGGALMIVGPAIQAVGFAVGGLGLAIKGVLLYLSVMKTMVAFMLTWPGMLLKGVDFLATGIVASAAKSTGAIASLKEGFFALGSIAKTTWGGIVDMMAAGDMGGAAAMAWLGIKTAWGTGIEYLATAWRQFSGYFIDTFLGTARTIYGAFEKVWNGITDAFGMTVEFIGKTWTQLTSGLSDDTSRTAQEQKVELDFMEKVWVFLARAINGAWSLVRVGYLTVVNGIATAWDYLCHGMKVGFNEFVGFFQKAWAKVRNIFNPAEARRQIAAINDEIAASNAASRAALDQRVQERGREAMRAAAEGIAVDNDIVADAERRQRILNREIERRRASREEATAEGRERIEALNRELEKMREAAREKARLTKQEADADAVRGRGPGNPKLDSDNASKLEAKGTFSAFALWGLGSASVTGRIARATEQTAANTRRIAEAAAGPLAEEFQGPAPQPVEPIMPAPVNWNNPALAHQDPIAIATAKMPAVIRTGQELLALRELARGKMDRLFENEIIDLAMEKNPMLQPQLGPAAFKGLPAMERLQAQIGPDLMDRLAAGHNAIFAAADRISAPAQSRAAIFRDHDREKGSIRNGNDKVEAILERIERHTSKFAKPTYT